jgi:hypothetical protein
MTGRLAVIILLASCAVACTAAHSVRTIGKGNAGVEVSLGGPIFTNLGAPIPAPNLFIGGRYGVRDDLDLSLHYNLTTPIIPGIALDLIMNEHWVPLQPGLGVQKDTPKKGWSLATSGSVHLLTDFKNGAVALPAVEVAGGWRYKWLNPYLGVSLALHFFRPEGHHNPAFLSPFVGMDAILNDEVSLALRVTFFDVAYNMYGSQVEWIHLVDDTSHHKKYGMVGLSLGFSYDFVKKPPRTPHRLGTGGAR